MIRNNFKDAYLKSKTPSSSLTRDRIDLGKREIDTLLLLAEEIGCNLIEQLTILDLGCADRFLEPTCNGRGWHYVGLDYKDVDFEKEKLPIESNSIDIAISLAVIEHLRDPEIFITEILRCLKPGGLVYLSTPNFQLDFKNFYNDPTHVRPYTPISLVELLRLNGFVSAAAFPGLRCKDIAWYRGFMKFSRAYYLLPFRNDTLFPVPSFLKGHARSVFGLAMKSI